MEFQATGSDITVDALLIFMAQQHATASCHIQERTHTVDHFILIRGRIFILGHIEGEQPQILRTKNVGNLQAVPQGIQMGVKIILQLDLTDGRADGPGHKAIVVHLRPNLTGLIQRDLGHIHAIHATNFQALQAVALHSGDLAIYQLVRFIRKGKNAHFFQMRSSFPISFIWILSL